MAAALGVLGVTTPFFALVLLGWVAVRCGQLEAAAVPGLNRFVLFVALPAMLLRFAAVTPIAQLLDPVVLGCYLAAAVAMVALALGWARRAGQGWADGAFGALLAAFPNSGFMGVPLLVALLGPAAAAPAIVALAVDMVVTSSLCIALSQLGGGDARAALWRVARGMVLNPLPWAIGLGTTLSASGWRPAPPVWRVVELLADAASPVALFALGAMLAGGGLGWRAPVARVAVPVALKLLLHPLLVALACALARQAGAPLEPMAMTVLVLLAALPGASNVPILGERYGADPHRLALVVLWGTVAAFATFSLAAALLHPAAPVAASARSRG